MKTLVIIQARMSSLRLPKKMMRRVSGIPLYLYVYRRCQLVDGVSDVVLATSDCSQDDCLAEDAMRNQCLVFRGNLENVLSRFTDCAQNFNASTIVRVCGDSPFVDVEWISRTLKHFHAENLDYVGWNHQECIPGLDSEIIKTSVLTGILNSNPDENEREHVTLRVRKNIKNYAARLYEWDCMKAEYRGVRVTVDTRFDWERATWLSRILMEKGTSLRYSSRDMAMVISQLVSKNENELGRF